MLHAVLKLVEHHTLLMPLWNFPVKISALYSILSVGCSCAANVPLACYSRFRDIIWYSNLLGIVVNKRTFIAAYLWQSLQNHSGPLASYLRKYLTPRALLMDALAALIGGMTSWKWGFIPTVCHTTLLRYIDWLAKYSQLQPAHSLISLFHKMPWDAVVLHKINRFS